MKLNKYDTMTNAIKDLKNKGYSHDFNFKNGKLHAIGTEYRFGPSEIKIAAFHRFEGKSGADDMSVVYAVESNSGVKGTIVDAYGTYANPQLAEFIKKVEVEAYD